MGQANSRGAGQGAGAGAPPEQRTLGRRGLRRVSRVPAGDSASGSDHDTSNGDDRVPALLLRRGTAPAANTPSRRLSQRLNPFQRYSSPAARAHAHAHDAVPSSPSSTTTSSTPRRPQSRLTRARSSLGSFSDLLTRPSISHRSTTEPVFSVTQTAATAQASLAPTTAATTRPRSTLGRPHSERGPSLPHVPSLADLDLDFDSLLGGTAGRDRSDSNRSRPPLTPSSLRRDGRALSMLPRLRNSLGSSRRRRSLWHDDDNMDSIERLRRGEDQADVLSRLLSLAAAATAASLVGEDHQQATRDGTFDTFLQSLQNGSIASALRDNGGGEGGDTPGGAPAPLNFFRMFRFGTNGSTSDSESGRASASGPGAQDGDEDGEGRMVPIIIVGIRSINPASGTGQDDGNIPPFIDALSSFPTPPTSPGDNDHILQPPQNGTRFSHRRRARLDGADAHDDDGHHAALAVVVLRSAGCAATAAAHGIASVLGRRAKAEHAEEVERLLAALGAGAALPALVAPQRGRDAAVLQRLQERVEGAVARGSRVVLADERGGRGCRGQRQQPRQHVGLVLAPPQPLHVLQVLLVVPQRAAPARPDHVAQAAVRGQQRQHAAIASQRARGRQRPRAERVWAVGARGGAQQAVEVEVEGGDLHARQDGPAVAARRHAQAEDGLGAARAERGSAQQPRYRAQRRAGARQPRARTGRRRVVADRRARVWPAVQRREAPQRVAARRRGAGTVSRAVEQLGHAVAVGLRAAVQQRRRPRHRPWAARRRLGGCGRRGLSHGVRPVSGAGAPLEESVAERGVAA